MEKYFVSIFREGKCVKTMFVEGKDKLSVLRATNQGCEITAFSLDGINPFKEERPKKVSKLRTLPDNKRISNRFKNWGLTVKCLETGQVFSSIRECSDAMGIPYTTIVNCLKNGNQTRGYHFVYSNKEDNGEENRGSGASL